MRLITTRAELDALPADSALWSKSLHSDHPGAPYEKGEEEWWDFGNEYYVGSNDISLPAVLIEKTDFTTR